MQDSDIKDLLNAALALDELHIKFDGSQAKIIAVGSLFADLSRVKKQQVVYAPLAQAINEGSIHAVTIKTFTPEVWKREKMFNLPL